MLLHIAGSKDKVMQTAQQNEHVNWTTKCKRRQTAEQKRNYRAN